MCTSTINNPTELLDSSQCKSERADNKRNFIESKEIEWFGQQLPCVEGLLDRQLAE